MISVQFHQFQFLYSTIYHRQIECIGGTDKAEHKLKVDFRFVQNVENKNEQGISLCAELIPVNGRGYHIVCTIGSYFRVPDGKDFRPDMLHVCVQELRSCIRSMTYCGEYGEYVLPLVDFQGLWRSYLNATVEDLSSKKHK